MISTPCQHIVHRLCSLLVTRGSYTTGAQASIVRPIEWLGLSDHLKEIKEGFGTYQVEGNTYPADRAVLSTWQCALTESAAHQRRAGFDQNMRPPIIGNSRRSFGKHRQTIEDDLIIHSSELLCTLRVAFPADAFPDPAITLVGRLSYYKPPAPACSTFVFPLKEPTLDVLL